jgi:hypothetical protein
MKSSLSSLQEDRLMASASSPSKTGQSIVLLPPEERFWKRYSPHYEMPLAGVTSICLHGLALAFLVLGGLAFFFHSQDEASKPPSLDVVQMGGMGDGLEEGTGGAAGAPGDPGSDVGKTEVAGPATPEVGPQTEETSKTPELQQATLPQLEVPTLSEAPDQPATSVDAMLEKVRIDAEKRVKSSETVKAPSAPAKVAKAAVASVGKGTGGVRGTGGKGGTGTGPGGGKKGPGPGSGPGGREMTQAEVRANRWRFDFSGTGGGGAHHADKLAGAGFVIAFPDNKGNYLVVQDPRRRPVALKRHPTDEFKDAVAWKSERAESTVAMVHDLGLRFMPAHTVIMAPKELEQRMANEEARHAQQVGRDVQGVRSTTFDFRLEGGRYVPVVLRME